jgi:hypothetical protein
MDLRDLARFRERMENGAQGRSLSAIRGLRDTGASVHNGRSRPSVACATPVHPCTLESNHRHADFQSEGLSVMILNYNYIGKTDIRKAQS